MSIRLLLILLSGLLLLNGCGYNQIQKNEEAVFAAWADVEATYQRRADLIPNLVETIKAYAAHEKETLLGVTNARAKVGQMNISADKLGDVAAMQQFQQAQGELSGALSRLLVDGLGVTDRFEAQIDLGGCVPSRIGDLGMGDLLRTAIVHGAATGRIGFVPAVPGDVRKFLERATVAEAGERRIDPRFREEMRGRVVERQRLGGV